MKDPVWCIEIFGMKTDAVARKDEILRHLSTVTSCKIYERTIRVDGERVDAFVLVVRAARKEQS